jgi:hypothetical protein
MVGFVRVTLGLVLHALPFGAAGLVLGRLVFGAGLTAGLVALSVRTAQGRGRPAAGSAVRHS